MNKCGRLTEEKENDKMKYMYKNSLPNLQEKITQNTNKFYPLKNRKENIKLLIFLIHMALSI
jgi:hypothetical protein